MDLTFYDYWRSSSAYRVRIALNLKGVDFRGVEVDLLAGEQRAEGYLGVNPQGLVPALEVDGQVITQSLAIILWLEEQFPEPPLLPADPVERAQALSRAMVIAADIQPLQNLRVLNALRNELSATDEQVSAWIHRWIGAGFAALEAEAPEEGFLAGDRPGLPDVYLVPQMFNARRYKLPLDPYPRLVRIEEALRRIDAFAQASPEAVRPG
jgi:maleylacetoacetate isomerase